MRLGEYLNSLLEIGALIVAFTSIIIFIFFLILFFDNCIVLTEPNVPVRLAEIVMGIIALGVIFNMIRKSVMKILAGDNV